MEDRAGRGETLLLWALIVTTVVGGVGILAAAVLMPFLM